MEQTEYDRIMLQQLLVDCRKELTFQALMRKYPMRQYEMLSYLYYFYLHPVKKINMDYLVSEIKRNIITHNVHDDWLGIISDTHFGSKEYHQEDVNYAYQKMYEKNVRTVFHCGDFLDGFVQQQKNNLDFLRQLDNFLKQWPNYTDMTHIFLIGNHDFTFLQRDIDLPRYINLNRPDLFIAGVERIYLKFHKRVIQFTHPIKQEHISIPIEKADFYMNGHTHCFSYRPSLSKIFLAPLCNKVKENDFPGYSILRKDGLDYFFQQYRLDCESPKREILLMKQNTDK